MAWQRLLAVVVFAVVLAGGTGATAQKGPQVPSGPAVLFTGSSGGRCGFQVARKLAEAGFALNRTPYPGLNETPLSWDVARNYNVIVLCGLGRANADMTLGKTKQSIETLNRYLEAGGGVLVFGTFGQMATAKPPQDAFLKPLGLTPLFDEMPSDPGTSVRATAWKLDFAFTDAVSPSPVTAGVKSLWYPVPDSRVGAQNHTTTFVADENWQVIVKGSKTSITRKGALQQAHPTAPGTYRRDVPLVAIRQVGRGRIMYLATTHEYVTGPNATTTLEGIFLSRGLNGRPSDGLTLLENGLRWLAEPSLSSGALGGAAMDAEMLRDPHKTRFAPPFDWPEKVKFPPVQAAYEGLIGARTTYSSGKATPEQWVAAAKAKGLSYIVFLEQFSALSPDEFRALKADCARLSSAHFWAIPGFTIDDEVGNHYFYFGTTFPYPDSKFLSPDGKVLRSHDPELNAEQPYIKGQLAMTTLDYAYSISSFKLTAGNYLFSQDAAPFADFFSDWDAVGVITTRGGELVEDSTEDFLRMVDSGQGPLPLAIDLMDSPQQMDAAGWRTVLRLPARGGSLIGGRIRPESKISDYFNSWHFYPDNPCAIYITSGPQIENWSYFGPRDYPGNTRGDFVWQDYRWLLHGTVSSHVGLKEVAVYDGTELFRRFLPRGKKNFEFALDLTHDKQHNLVLIATDLRGDGAVSGEQWDRNHRLEEFMCGDRNNQLSYGYLTNSKGTGIMLGGNQTLGTPIKRIASQISPSGTFKNDALLGAPAFDGAAGGEPNFFDVVAALGTKSPVPVPNVSESRRLLHTGDVHIGEGIREHYFADNIGVYNVWHTLWRTKPATFYTVRRRNHFFQIDPDSPLAVFLWRIDIALKRDMPNKGFRVAVLSSREDRLWTLRTGDNSLYCGTWEETVLSRPRRLALPFDRGAYAAFLDSPLGGAAVFPLTDGLTATLNLPGRHNLEVALPAAHAPQKKGQNTTVELLVLGIPRITAYTKDLPSASNEVVERFYHDFGLDGGPTGYTVRAEQGTVLDRRYILRVDGAPQNCFSGTLDGHLISSLPITVCNLNDNWSSFLYDRGLKKARPIGTFEGKAWATVCLNGHLDLFIGQPLVADDPNVVIQLTQCGENAWSLEVHNPTDADITTAIRKNPFFDPLKEKPFTQQTLTVSAGSSYHEKL